MVELLIVVGIIALVAVMAAPGVIRQLPAYYVRGAQDRIQSLLVAARMRAISEGRAVQFRYLSSSQSFRVGVDMNGNGALDSGEFKDIRITERSGIQVYPYPATGSFQPDGSFLAAGSVSPMSIYVWKSNASVRSVGIWPSGRIANYAWAYTP